MQQAIQWMIDNWGEIAAVLIPLYTLLVRLFPTSKNLDFIGKLIAFLNAKIPNKAKDGGTH